MKKATDTHQLCLTCKYNCKQLPSALIDYCKLLNEDKDARKLNKKIQSERRNV